MRKVLSSLLMILLITFCACSSSKPTKRLAIWDTVPQSEQVAEEEVAEVKEEKEDKYAKYEKLAEEAAKNNALRTANESATVTKTAASSKDALSKEYDTPSINRMFHAGDYTPEAGYSGSIHKYNVVIAALSINRSANRLKGQLIGENENVFMGKSTTNGYTYLVLGSYDNKDEAVKRSSGFLNKYMSRYNRTELYRKYRIPFVDIWILNKNSGYASVATPNTSGYSSAAYRPAGVSPSSSILPATAAKLSSIGMDEQAIADVFKDGQFVTENESAKKYNLVVATTPSVERAVRTKELLSKDNESAFIGVDANGIHYVMVGSYNTAEEAYSNRVSFMSKYLNQYSQQQLKSKYGSNFVDSWVLVK